MDVISLEQYRTRAERPQQDASSWVIRPPLPQGGGSRVVALRTTGSSPDDPETAA